MAKRNGLAALLNDNGGKHATKQDTAQGPFYKFFNFKRVIDITGIQQDKVYNNLKGTYDSLSPKDKGDIANVLIPAVKKLFTLLGYECNIRKVS